MGIQVVCDHFKKNANSCCICPADNTTLKSHHDMIHSKFSATLDRHMLKPVVNHQDYYFYDLIDDFVSYLFLFNYFINQLIYNFS